MTDEDAVVASARAWILADPDPETRSELDELVRAADLDALRERFVAPLSFGTAGLRGIVGSGPARMNRAVVLRATHAVAEYLLENERDVRTLPVVVGYDARPTSRAFAEATASVLVAARIPVRYFEAPVPTPLVAYAVRQLSATAGIMITASHNPPEYNGYKLYGGNGAQIVPPVDRAIEGRIAGGPSAAAIPVTPDAMGGRSLLSTPIPESVVDRYLAEIGALVPCDPTRSALRIVYTPLHGVGRALAEKALRAAGFDDVRVVPEQAEPDGTFPTVRFPNPEEPGALDLAVALATRERADLILANDPDADRLGVAVPTASGRFIPLTGNQIGVLLADFVLARSSRVPRPLVVSTVVSSPMIERVASFYGARFERTLTGFKWIAMAALALEASESVRFAFGFEEALGYAAGRFVRDKDGISAAVLFAALAAQCRAERISVRERLETLYRRHGLWVSAQLSVVRAGNEGAAEIARAMDRAAASPPAAIGEYAVESVTDFRRRDETRPPWLGEAPLVVLSLGNSGRAVLRPSGTEPKLKIYVDLRGEAGDDARNGEAALHATAKRVAEAVRSHLGM